MLVFLLFIAGVSRVGGARDVDTQEGFFVKCLVFRRKKSSSDASRPGQRTQRGPAGPSRGVPGFT